VSHRDRFMREYESARVNLTLTEEGYARHITGLYPDELIIVDMLLHAAWIVVALFFAFRTSQMSWLGTTAISLWAIILALLFGAFMPLGFLGGSAALCLGIVTLPFHALGGPLGLYGLNSVVRSLHKWYGRNLIKRWCLGSEEQFLGAVADRTIVVAANRYATEDTRLFLVRLAEVCHLH
jgi:hypothetical protein